MKYDKDNVPNGYYKLENPAITEPVIVRVMDIAGKRVVSFINRDNPTPLNEIAANVKFSKSTKADLGLTPEERVGREQEMVAYLLELLSEDRNLQVTRTDKGLYVSRMDKNKRYFFNFSAVMDAVGEDE